MKSLPRLALGAFFAAMLAITTHATTQTCSTNRWNDTGYVFGQGWSITVPSNVNITTSITTTANSPMGGGGQTSVSRSGTTVVVANTSGTGTHSDGDAAFGQPAGTYQVSHAFGGPPNTVYASMYTALTW